MSRLTERSKITGYAYFPKCFEKPCEGEGCREDDCEFLDQVCDKLASYEDTGLTPDQIIQMDKLYQQKCEELARLKEAYGYTE